MVVGWARRLNAVPSWLLRPAAADVSLDEQRIGACGFDKTFKLMEVDRNVLEALSA